MAKEHYCRFIEPIRSSESGFPLVSLLNPNVVVPPPDVQLSEIPGMLQSIDEVRNTRKEIGVLDGMRIDVAIVLARIEHAILLQNKEEEGCLWELRENKNIQGECLGGQD